MTQHYPYKNLVFEGGGVKGVAYGGVFEVLEQKQITRMRRRSDSISSASFTNPQFGKLYRGRD